MHSFPAPPLPHKSSDMCYFYRNTLLRICISVLHTMAITRARAFFAYLRLCCTYALVQFSSVTQLCPTICDPMNGITPGLPVHHQLLEFTQTHVHWVGDAIQPFHPLSSPSPPAPNPSQHQGLFQWVSSSSEVAKVLEFQLQHQSLQVNTQDWSSLGWTGWISLQSKGLSKNLVQHHSSKASIFRHSAFFYAYPFRRYMKGTFRRVSVRNPGLSFWLKLRNQMVSGKLNSK